MYKCDKCGMIFDTPQHVCDTDTGYGMETCSNCGSDEFREVDRCKCGNAKAVGDCLCDDCRAILAATMRMVLGTMSKEELDQIDEWMDGESIHDYKNWR